ncbi:MAG: methyltransferase domain-containing protein [Candidatus Omnitrophica bacterium]|nr:methyltransferase domain-containing protein [Candidatus Omnitrophota bacterium]MCF7894198.1 methyltransferase domain-containing protein [Candidatus Omnitrophota bacterium]
MDLLAKQTYQEYLEKNKFYRKFGYDIEAERNFILDKAKPLSGDILEVGTGKGSFTVILAKRGYNFVSVDASYDQQKIGYLKLKHLSLDNQVIFKIENAENLSFKDKSFSTVISVNMIHHLDDPLKVVNEFTRVLKSKGKILLADFTKEGLEVINKIHLQRGNRHRTERIDFSELEKYFSQKGFKLERYRDKFQKILLACH